MTMRRRVTRLLRPALLIVVSLLAGRIVIGLIGAVDWGQVAAALGRLTWVSVPVLIALLLVRQGFNTVPLARFVPGLGWWRSAQNDVTADLIGTVAPPPGDVVIRVSMFRSWGISPVDGMTGVTLNSLTFYVIRFAAPSLGLVVLVGEELAAGRVAARLREEADPDQWAESVLDFRQRRSTRLTGGLPASLLALTAMVIADGLVLLTALRAVGVADEPLPFVWVLGAFLIAYPLTAMPLAGLGLLDAALVVAWWKWRAPASSALVGTP